MLASVPFFRFLFKRHLGVPSERDKERSPSKKRWFMLPTIKITFMSIGVIFLAIGIGSCVNKAVENSRGEDTMPSKTIEEVLKEHTDELMSIPGVVGTAEGLCDGSPCIKVFVIEITPELEQKILNILEGYPVEVEETGEFEALPENPD